MKKHTAPALRSAFLEHRVHSGKLQRVLTECGLCVRKCGNNHYRVTRKDGVGGVVFVSATPSDHRSSMNEYRHIAELLRQEEEK